MKEGLTMVELFRMFGHHIIVSMVLGGALTLVFAIPTTWAWNYSVPRIFGPPAIGYLDAVCLIWLACRFFKVVHTVHEPGKKEEAP